MNRSVGAGRFTLRVLKRRQPPSVKHFYQRSLDAEDLTAPPAAAAASSVRGSAAKCLEMLSRLLHGEFSLGSGRHAAPRFLQPLMSGEDVLNFSSESDEFRRQLGKQLQQLRQTLKKGQQKPPKAESEKTARSWRSRRGESEESERRPGTRPVRGESEESEKTRAARTPEPKKTSQDPRNLGRRSDKAIRSESEESEESERYPHGALRVQRTSEPKKTGSEPKRSNRAVRSESEESEESKRYSRAGRSNRAIRSESEESEESERYPYGALRNPRAVRTPEPMKAGTNPKRSNRDIRSESEESEESELRPRARNYQVSESERTLKGSRQSSRKVRAESEESEESEKIAESEESERQPKPRDPNLIEGIYWTGEGKRLEVRDPREGKKPDSGYIAGDGRDLNAEPSDAPRGQTSSKDLKDE